MATMQVLVQKEAHTCFLTLGDRPSDEQHSRALTKHAKGPLKCGTFFSHFTEEETKDGKGRCLAPSHTGSKRV